MEKRAAIAAIAFSAFLWGLMPFAVKWFSGFMGAWQLVALRYTAGGLALLALADVRRLLRIVKRSPVEFAVLALVAQTLSNGFFVMSLAHLPVSVANFLASSYPTLAILLAFAFLGEKPNGLGALAALVGFSGILLVADPFGDFGRSSLLGVLFALLAAAGWAVAGVLAKILLKRAAPGEVAAGRCFLGGVLAFAFVPFQGGFSPVSPAILAAVAMFGIISAASMLLYYKGMSGTSLALTSIVEAINPFVTAAAGALLFSERLSFLQLAGGSLIFISIWLGAKAHPARPSG